jgi:hypothetical protein
LLGVHRLLDVLMIWLLLAGWVPNSVSIICHPIVLHGLLPWPDLSLFGFLRRDAALEAVVRMLQVYAGWLVASASPLGG